MFNIDVVLSNPIFLLSSALAPLFALILLPYLKYSSEILFEARGIQAEAEMNMNKKLHNLDYRIFSSLREVKMSVYYLLHLRTINRILEERAVPPEADLYKLASVKSEALRYVIAKTMPSTTDISVYKKLYLEGGTVIHLILASRVYVPPELYMFLATSSSLEVRTALILNHRTQEELRKSYPYLKDEYPQKRIFAQLTSEKDIEDFYAMTVTESESYDLSTTVLRVSGDLSRVIIENKYVGCRLAEELLDKYPPLKEFDYLQKASFEYLMAEADSDSKYKNVSIQVLESNYMAKLRAELEKRTGVDSSDFPDYWVVKAFGWEPTKA